MRGCVRLIWRLRRKSQIKNYGIKRFQNKKL